MLVYQRTAHGEKRPAWKNNCFMRLSGLGDAIFHKVELREESSGIRRLHSGRIERMQREFASYEEAKRQELISKLSVLQAALARDVRSYQALTPRAAPAAEDKPLTSWELKEARQRREQDAQRREKREALAASLSRNLCLLEQTSGLFDSEIDQARAQCNASVARYAKAALFQTIDQGIPVLQKHIQAADLVDARLVQTVKEVLEDEKSL